VVPDATTVWLFRERLVKAKAIERLFARFDTVLKERGYLAMGGQIIDATVVPAPKQRNTWRRRRRSRKGRTPEDWTLPRPGRRIGMRAGRSNTARPKCPRAPIPGAKAG
jgi:hypothetical protein